MQRLQVTNSEQQLTADYKMSHFWYPKFGSKGDFSMPICLVDAQQRVVDFYSEKYGRKIWYLPTSVYRPVAEDWDPHKLGDACDSITLDESIWAEIVADIRNELKNWRTSKLVKNIVATGCNVIIIENGCLHLCWRDHNLDYKEELGTSVYFGEWKKAPKGQEEKYPKGINTKYSI